MHPPRCVPARCGEYDGTPAMIERLLAYIVAPDDATGDIDACFGARRRALPPVVDSRPVIVVDALPRTAVGKVDKPGCGRNRPPTSNWKRGIA